MTLKKDVHSRALPVSPLKYRTKSVTIEAILYQGELNFNFVRLFVGNDTPLHRLGDQRLGIPTLEGVMTANVGDFIVKGLKGEFYPCKPDIFAMKYEELA